MRHSSAEPVVVRHSVFVLSIVVLFCSTTFSQSGLPRTVPALTPPSHALPEPPPKDPLNRATPRDTVLAFLTATQKKDFAVAAEYLDTRAHGKAAEDLARQLSIVLDRRLPARLNQLSDKPEGSQTDPLHPDRDLVGTIRSSKVDVPIFLERIDRGKSGLVWLFSRQTLESLTDLAGCSCIDTDRRHAVVDAYETGVLITRTVIGFAGKRSVVRLHSGKLRFLTSQPVDAVSNHQYFSSDLLLWPALDEAD